MSSRLGARTALATALAAALVAGGGATARAEAPEACYAVDARTLTGPSGAELTLRVAAAPGCAAAADLKKVQLKVYDAAGEVADVRNVNDVALTDGAKTFDLGEVARGRRIDADVLIQTDEPKRTWVVRSETTALLRPDLVAQIVAPVQTLTVRPIGVRAEIAEANGDVGAEATVTLSWDGAAPLTQRVTVPAGGRVSVQFVDVALTNARPTELKVAVSGAAPAETDETNNGATATVDVTEHELARSRLILDNLGGYGTQFNHHVFAKITPAPPGTIGGLEAKVDALEPQIVRIFFNDADESATFPDRLASFIEVVRMAHEAGATINITYQTAARARLNPVPFMAQFAAVLEDLVENRGYTNIRWVTIQNEPNRAANLTKDQYQALHRALHAELVSRGLREHVRMMVGDLVEAADNGTNPHREWMAYIVANMLDLVDAYSEHIYWNHWQGGRMEYRLRDTRRLMFEELPPEARRPVYLIEYGVRGIQTNFPGKPNLPGGYYADGTEMVRTNISAFQQLWFNIVAAQYGFAGTAKWDTYWGVFDANRFGVPNWQAYYMIGPAAEGWPLFPTYHALRMLFQTTARGWQIVGVDPWANDDWALEPGETWNPAKEYDQREKEIAAWQGGGQLTMVGLDTNGRNLNAASTEMSSYSIAGLPPLTTLNLGLWNGTGNGENVLGGTVTTNAVGVARFDVPQHGAFALTTVPMS